MQPIIDVQNLSKKYKIGAIQPRYLSLRDSLSSTFKSVKDWTTFKKLSNLNTNNEFWALKDINFRVNAGESIGIIGRNGAGKSTLLKILSRITPPTSGNAILRGRLASLLEVGTGFHPELTGRENVYFNGSILGLRKAEINKKFDEIVDFSGVERFIDTPLKNYSSGMQLRLAFAVAAHLEPEILIIDEVLAVGDAEFQKKCLGKMDEVSKSGRTVIFVSHNMGAVRSLCEEAILIDGGRLVMSGKPGDVISHYLSASMPKDSEVEGQIWWNGDKDAPRCEDVALRGIRLLNPEGVPQSTFEADKPIAIEIHYEVLQRLRGARFCLMLITQEGELAFTATDHLFQQETQLPGSYKTVCRIPGGLLNRRNYVVNVQCDVPGERFVLHGADYLNFTVGGVGNQASHFPESWPGVVCPRVEWKVEAVEK